MEKGPESQVKPKKWFIRILVALAGGTAGYVYYHYVGCITGTCPITSNPILSIGYGAMIGLVLVWNRGPHTSRRSPNDPR